MANRFLETNYYKSPYVRGLKGSLKGLYSFIICDCTSSGIWAMDMEAASLYIGFQVTFDEFEEYFIKKGKAIDLGNGKYFFPDFIEHQYPKGLSDKSTAHINIIPELKRLGLIDENNRVLKAPLKQLQSPKGNGNGIGKVNKEFNHYPNGESEDLELPETYIKKAIEYLDINKQIKKTNGQISVIWDIFKLENFTGKNYYEDEAKVFTHFLRSLKNEKANALQQIFNQQQQPKSKPVTDEQVNKYRKNV